MNSEKLARQLADLKRRDPQKYRSLRAAYQKKSAEERKIQEELAEEAAQLNERLGARGARASQTARTSSSAVLHFDDVESELAVVRRKVIEPEPAAPPPAPVTLLESYGEDEEERDAKERLPKRSRSDWQPIFAEDENMYEISPDEYKYLTKNTFIKILTAAGKKVTGYISFNWRTAKVLKIRRGWSAISSAFFIKYSNVKRLQKRGNLINYFELDRCQRDIRELREKLAKIAGRKPAGGGET